MNATAPAPEAPLPEWKQIVKEAYEAGVAGDDSKLEDLYTDMESHVESRYDEGYEAGESDGGEDGYDRGYTEGYDEARDKYEVA